MDQATKIETLKKFIAQLVGCIDTGSVDQIGRALLVGIEETANEYDWRDTLRETNPEMYETLTVMEENFKESE